MNHSQDDFLPSNDFYLKKKLENHFETKHAESQDTTEDKKDIL